VRRINSGFLPYVVRPSGFAVIRFDSGACRTLKREKTLMAQEFSYSGSETTGPSPSFQPHLFPPIWADPYAYPSFRFREDHANKRLYVSGTVGNRGNIPNLSPIRVAVGITVRIAGLLIHNERIVRMERVRPGELEFTEPETRAPLAYFNEDNGAKYLFETLILRADHPLIDVSAANNYYSYTWWAIDPDVLARDDSVEFGNVDQVIDDFYKS
jgi:hypothetical protein